jgi:hypothetical protein
VWRAIREPAMSMIRKLGPREELEYLREIHGDDQGRLFSILVESFNVLQYRAQLLLGLITICLTITGFSGPRIAESGTVAKLSLIAGLALVLCSALIILVGPLQLRWGTQRRGETLDESLIFLIHVRNQRTRRYHTASALLILGLFGYVGSVIGYLLEL